LSAADYIIDKGHEFVVDSIVFYLVMSVVRNKAIHVPAIFLCNCNKLITMVFMKAEVVLIVTMIIIT